MVFMALPTPLGRFRRTVWPPLILAAGLAYSAFGTPITSDLTQLLKHPLAALQHPFTSKLRNASRPAITVTVSPIQVSQGQSATFTVRSASINPTSAIIVNFIINGNAVLGTHYSLSSSFGQVVIPAGANTASVVLTALV